MLRVLHVVGAMERSGQETFLMNIYRCIDRSRVQFDFVVHRERRGAYEDEIAALGGRVFRAARKRENLPRNLSDICRITADGGYRIIHRHTSTAAVFTDLLAARAGGAQTCILHAHSTMDAHRHIHNTCRPLAAASATHIFACSEAAGHWMVGNSRFTVIPNGIDTKAFRFDPLERTRVRKELGLQDRFVIGHVGRFCAAKNQMFLLDVLQCLRKRTENAVLLLAGDGGLFEEFRQKAERMGLTEQIRLVGVRQDVPCLLSAMDVFAFPSLYEGLPLALLEAQASGLMCVVSDTVTREVFVTPLACPMPVDSTPDVWANQVMRLADTAPSRVGFAELVKASGFDAVDCAMRLQAFYLECDGG